jgi:hypothetical protein
MAEVRRVNISERIEGGKMEGGVGDVKGEDTIC